MILVFSLSFGSFSNAHSEVTVNHTCFDAADTLARELNFITGGTMTHEMEYNFFYAIYLTCQLNN